MWKLVVLGLVVLVSFPDVSYSAIPPSEREALMDIYYATLGKNWKNKRHWGDGDPCQKEWYGVRGDGGSTCASEVSFLNLTDNLLVGPLPSSISNLTRLNTLLLASNSITGSLPSTIGRMLTLAQIDLSSNSLEGTIPSTFLNLRSVVICDLSKNMLEGILPPALGTMTNITNLNLGYNSLAGSIPDLFLKMTDLDLSNNLFSGSLVLSFDQMKVLQTLKLNNNALSGSLPSTLFSAPQQKTMDLSHNNFEGSFPADLVSTALTYLNLAGNSMSGDLVNIATCLPKIETLILSDNIMEGSLDMNWTNFDDLSTLDVSYNRFEGPFPISITMVPRLRDLDMTGNAMEGTIPFDIGDMNSLALLGLAENQFYGNLTAFSSIQNLQYLDVNSNMFSGPLAGPFENTGLISLSVALNAFNTELSVLDGTFPKTLEFLDCHSNEFSGDITAIFPSDTRIAYLNARDNAFASALPDTNFMTKLEELTLSDNAYVGDFPSEFILGSIPYLDLSNNRINGTLPDSSSMMAFTARIFGSKSSPVEIYLQDNKIQGFLPLYLSQLQNLTKLNISSNDMSGDVPEFTSPILSLFDISHNSFTGVVGDWVCEVNDVDLSETYLSCPLPTCCGTTISCSTCIPVGGFGIIQSMYFYVGVGVLLILVVVGMVGAALLYRRQRRKKAKLRGSGYIGINNADGVADDFLDGSMSQRIGGNALNAALLGTSSGRQDPLLGSGVHLRVNEISVEKGEGEDSEPVLTFIVKVKIGFFKWKVKRTYADFLALDKTLNELYPDLSPPKPPKQKLKKLLKSSSFEGMKKQFTLYLRNLVIWTLENELSTYKSNVGVEAHRTRRRHAVMSDDDSESLTDESKSFLNQNTIRLESTLRKFLLSNRMKISKIPLGWQINPRDLVILGTIGSGSYGHVSMGRWKGINVAVKALHSKSITDKKLEDFKNEVALLSKLRHRNIVMFYGSVLQPPNFYLVTEWVKRGNLYQIIHDKSFRFLNIPFGKRIRMGLDVAFGVQYLHTRLPPVVHRDLKSTNLLVDQKWVVKLADFGLSQVQVESLTSVVGTPAWVAPEILQGKSYNCSSDLYGFGVVLWELVSGARPWANYKVAEVLGAVMSGQRLPIPQNTDEDIAKLIEACWADSDSRPLIQDVCQCLCAVIDTYPPWHLEWTLAEADTELTSPANFSSFTQAGSSAMRTERSSFSGRDSGTADWGTDASLRPDDEEEILSQSSRSLRFKSSGSTSLGTETGSKKWRDVDGKEERRSQGVQGAEESDGLLLFGHLLLGQQMRQQTENLIPEKKVRRRRNTDSESSSGSEDLLTELSTSEEDSDEGDEEEESSYYTEESESEEYVGDSSDGGEGAYIVMDVADRSRDDGYGPDVNMGGTDETFHLVRKESSRQGNIANADDDDDDDERTHVLIDVRGLETRSEEVGGSSNRDCGDEEVQYCVVDDRRTTGAEVRDIGYIPAGDNIRLRIPKESSAGHWSEQQVLHDSSGEGLYLAPPAAKEDVGLYLDAPPTSVTEEGLYLDAPPASAGPDVGGPSSGPAGLYLEAPPPALGSDDLTTSQEGTTSVLSMYNQSIGDDEPDY